MRPFHGHHWPLHGGEQFSRLCSEHSCQHLRQLTRLRIACTLCSLPDAEVSSRRNLCSLILRRRLLLGSAESAVTKCHRSPLQQQCGARSNLWTVSPDSSEGLFLLLLRLWRRWSERWVLCCRRSQDRDRLRVVIQGWSGRGRKKLLGEERRCPMS